MKVLQAENELLERFKTELARASKFYLGMALVTNGGLKLVLSSIERCLEKRGQVQRTVDDVFQLGGHIRIQPHRGYGSVFQNGVEDQRRSVAPERHRSRTHLVQDRTERE